MKRILVAGSRPPDSAQLSLAGQRAWHDLEARCEAWVSTLPKDVLLITGGAAGIDAMAEHAAARAGIHCAVVKIPKVNWTTMGKRAGIVRDDVMMRLADEVAVFRFNRSRGSTYVMSKADAAGKLIHTDDVEAR